MTFDTHIVAGETLRLRVSADINTLSKITLDCSSLGTFSYVRGANKILNCYGDLFSMSNIKSIHC